jgi:hypothetical protein
MMMMIQLQSTTTYRSCNVHKTDAQFGRHMLHPENKTDYMLMAKGAPSPTKQHQILQLSYRNNTYVNAAVA